jgi:hypothetical protein
MSGRFSSGNPSSVRAAELLETEGHSPERSASVHTHLRLTYRARAAWHREADGMLPPDGARGSGSLARAGPTRRHIPAARP